MVKYTDRGFREPVAILRRVISFDILADAIISRSVQHLEGHSLRKVVDLLRSDASLVQNTRKELLSRSHAGSEQDVFIDVITLLQSSETGQRYVTNYVLQCYLLREKGERLSSDLPVLIRRLRITPGGDDSLRRAAERYNRMVAILTFLRELEAGLLLFCTLIEQKIQEEDDWKTAPKDEGGDQWPEPLHSVRRPREF